MKKRNVEKTEMDSGPKMVVGLDIGTTKVVFMAGYLRADGTVEVCGSGKTPSTGVEFGSVFYLQDTINDIIKAKQQLEEYLNEPIRKVYVGIAGRHIKSQAYNNMLLRPNGLDNMVTQEEIDAMTEQMRTLSVDSGKIVEVVPQNYVVDGKETMHPVGTLGQRINGTYQLIIGNDFEIKKITKSVEGAQLHCNKMILEPIASALVCLTEEEKKNGVALIDIGGGTTDLVIYVSGLPVFIKVIPIGGCVITKDIESLGVSFEQAEKLKIHHGTCLVQNANKNNIITISDASGYGEPLGINEASLAEVIRARVQQDILEPVKREIENSGYSKYVKNVVITGGSALLKDIRPLAEFVIQKRARLGAPSTGLCGSMDSQYIDPIYSTSLGLLRYGCLTENNPMSEMEFPEDDDNEKDGNNSDDSTRVSKWMNVLTNKFTEWTSSFNMEEID